MADKRLILTPRPPLEDSSEIPFRVFDNGDNSYSLGVRASLYGSGNVNAASGAVVGMTGAPANLTAGADTTIPFDAPIRHLFVQNKSATAVYLEFDATATVGSVFVDAGQSSSFDIPIATALHVYSTAATPVNGTADLNLYVRGWA